MELAKNYEAAAAAEKWYQHWMERGYFRSEPDERTPYTVVIPPPNVTGVLHMGHTLNETVQDILIRRARMKGYNACWVPGSDHASIATEARVVNMLREKNIEKSSLSREEFLRYAFEWKEKYGGIIYSQIRKLGCSCDWERVNFTMDDHYYRAVIKVFTDLYRKGLVYRGARMINWDPKAKTALSDEEVEYKDLEGKLYYVRYALEDGEGQLTGESITIATQRPETIMGDTAVCVNPDDERYKHLSGHFAIIPLVNRRVPLIFDDYVDPSFGTGALKVTPAHDINDYNLGLKYNLEVIDTLNEDGTLSDAAQVFVGMDRFLAREKTVAVLREQGLLVKEETYPTRLGYSQRNPDTVVEPRISTQWFVKMRELAQPALEAVTQGDVKIYPGDRFMATYKYWMENVKDWCISRQLWWGQRIPAWYDGDGNIYVAETETEALQQWAEANGKEEPSPADVGQLRQDDDVLDTWFSSWLWPMEVFRGITEPGNADIRYYYPTSVLVTGQDIIFFWVARMIMAGLEYEHQKPFHEVYFTGMVRDKLGRKMSKSLGNSPDLLQLIDQYGADAVRFGILISSPAGNDLLFDESSLEQGRFFCNKLWNAMKLVKLWEERQAEIPDENDNFALQWFEHRLREASRQLEELFRDFRLNEALKVIYSLIWDDFCSWYLEWIKPAQGASISAAAYERTVSFFEQLLQLLHPFMPFVTEELYHLLRERTEGDDLIVRQLPAVAEPDPQALEQGRLAQTVITALRDARNKNRLKPRDPITLHILTAQPAAYRELESILVRQVNAGALHYTDKAITGSLTLVVDADKFFIEADKPADTTAQREQLQKDLLYQQQFLAAVEKKLGNERFVQNASPAVVENERKKKSDAEARIKAITESLESGER
ncbi:valine--tRNA ligase [Compostibacter hankyongensis]|uniref:Valine--tRNA ligase n=1 Tax=Compostibacter hankyongensis TaxID=1007089 RepID=A0ABP8FPA7_9BACT